MAAVNTVYTDIDLTEIDDHIVRDEIRVPRKARRGSRSYLQTGTRPICKNGDDKNGERKRPGHNNVMDFVYTIHYNSPWKETNITLEPISLN